MSRSARYASAMITIFPHSAARDTAIEALLDSPLAREAEARASAALAERRAGLAARLAQLDREAEKAFHADRAATTKAKAAIAEAQQALTTARAKLAALEAQRIGEHFAWNREVEAVEAELRETCDPAINAAIAAWRDQFDFALKERVVETGTVERNPITGVIERKAGARVVQPADRIQAIREAIAACERLKLEPDQRTVPSALAEIRASVPDIGTVIRGRAND